MSKAASRLPPNDELAKKRQSVLEINLRTQLESAQAELRRNAELLTTLRRENKELQLSLTRAMRGQLNVGSEEHYQKEEELLHNKLCVLKRSLNSVKGKNTELQKVIETTMQEHAFTLKEGGAYVDEGSAVTQKIRTLENRLDKCLIKHNEVEAIRKTYEVILERLQLEQAGFDLQLNALEKTIASDEKELNDLNTVGAEAAKGRDEAKADVGRLKKKLVEERRQQRKDLDERRQFVQDKREYLGARHSQLLVKMAKQQERHNRILNGEDRRGPSKASKKKSSAQTNDPVFSPQELERIQFQKEAYHRLRDTTMSQNVAEVIHKLLERRHNHKNLKKVLSDLEDAISKKTLEVKRLRKKWDDVNQQSGGAMVRPPLTRSARDVQKRSNLVLEEPQQQKKAVALTDKGGAGTGAGGAPASPSGAAAPSATTVPPASKDQRGGKSTAEEEDDENLLSRLAYSDYRLLAERKRENKKIVEEFELHLRVRQDELEEAHREQESLSRLLLDVEAGVQQLAQKLFVGAAASAYSLTPPAMGGGGGGYPHSGSGLLTLSMGGDSNVSFTTLQASLTQGGLKNALSTFSLPHGGGGNIGEAITPAAHSSEELPALMGADGGLISSEGMGLSSGSGGLSPAGASGSTATVSLLRSCEEKIQGMLEELAGDEIEVARRTMLEEKVIIPATNIRLPQLLTIGGGGGGGGQMNQIGTSASGGKGGVNAMSNGGGIYSEGMEGDEEAGSVDYPGGGRTSSPSLQPGNVGGSGGGGAGAGGAGGSGFGGGKHYRVLPQLVDDFPDNEVHDRQELKMMSLAAVEREIKKAKQLQQRRKEEGH